MASLENLGDGDFAVNGELTLGSVVHLLQTSKQLFEETPPQRIDFVGVTRTDSAGVALLVEWFRQAKAQQQALQFINAPAQMMAIIRVADLDGLLPLAQGQIDNVLYV
jgi:phospholipid transport system transporter-binding protein